MFRLMMPCSDKMIRRHQKKLKPAPPAEIAKIEFQSNARDQSDEFGWANKKL